MIRLLCLALGVALLALASHGARADDDAPARGLRAVQGMAGCFLVDYSYVEVEGLRPSYARDPRVYDVNRDKSAKEWISVEVLSPRRAWLQRILFLTDLRGAVRPGSEIKHQSEDWEYEAPFLYDFIAPQTWHVRELPASSGLWTRRVTNLDDGPRYQCAGRWTSDTAYPEWSCSNYAPIPGRETRDMKRADYHTLDRTTRIVVYGPSWLERQDNVKTIHGDAGRTPLARETGKNWYVRLPDSECATAEAFARPRQKFWALLRETWDGILDGRGPFVEKTPPGQPPRFVRMHAIETDYIGRDLADSVLRKAAQDRIRAVVDEYRAR
jgi:hypothetical protein